MFGSIVRRFKDVRLSVNNLCIDLFGGNLHYPLMGPVFFCMWKDHIIELCACFKISQMLYYTKCSEHSHSKGKRNVGQKIKCTNLIHVYIEKIIGSIPLD